MAKWIKGKELQWFSGYVAFVHNRGTPGDVESSNHAWHTSLVQIQILSMLSHCVWVRNACVCFGEQCEWLHWQNLYYKNLHSMKCEWPVVTAECLVASGLLFVQLDFQTLMITRLRVADHHHQAEIAWPPFVRLRKTDHHHQTQKDYHCWWIQKSYIRYYQVLSGWESWHYLILVIRSAHGLVITVFFCWW